MLVQLQVMGMRIIRWRNGQCPRRNGQWAERIAHAGSEAVRLVPFSSLPAVILDYIGGYPSYRILCLSMALAAVPRCGTHHPTACLPPGCRQVRGACWIIHGTAADRLAAAPHGLGNPDAHGGVSRK